MFGTISKQFGTHLFLRELFLDFSLFLLHDQREFVLLVWHAFIVFRLIPLLLRVSISRGDFLNGFVTFLTAAGVGVVSQKIGLFDGILKRLLIISPPVVFGLGDEVVSIGEVVNKFTLINFSAI